MRRYSCLGREAHPTTVKPDLAAVWDQIGRWTANREVERVIPQIHFAENTENNQLPLGLRLIVTDEAVILEQAIQAGKITYGEWYHDRLATVTLPMATRAQSISFPGLLTSFGLGWNFDVVTDEFNLSRTQVKKLTDPLQLMTVNEVLALPLALGPTRFVAGRLAIVVNLVAGGGLLELYTYLVLAQGKTNGLIGPSEVLFLQDKQNCTGPLLKLRASLQHWLYLSLVFA